MYFHLSFFFRLNEQSHGVEEVKVHKNDEYDVWS